MRRGRYNTRYMTLYYEYKIKMVKRPVLAWQYLKFKAPLPPNYVFQIGENVGCMWFNLWIIKFKIKTPIIFPHSAKLLDQFLPGECSSI